MWYDAAEMEIVARRFRRDMWRLAAPDAVTESRVELSGFGPVQATAFGDLPEVHSLNQVQGAAEPGAVEEGHLAEAVEWMRSREVDYRVPVAESRPGASEAEAWLDRRGYERGSGWIKLVRDTAPPDWDEDREIAIFELGEDDADGEGMSEIISSSLDLPLTAGTLFFSLPQEKDWRCYTASLPADGGIVATASMLICDGVAQLGPDATLERGRGRGCHMALLRRRLLDAAEAGCRTVFAELGEDGADRLASSLRNLRRAGFEEAYGSRSWQRPALHPAEVR